MKTLKEKFWLNEEAETPHCEMSYRDYEAVGYFQGQKKAYEDDKEAVLKREEVTQNRINSIINMDEKDFEIADNMLGIKNWILGILEAEKQDNKEIFGDFK